MARHAYSGSMQKQQFLASHATAFPSRGQAPDHILVLPASTFRGRDGRGPYTLADAESVINATREHFGSADIVLDYGVSTGDTTIYSKNKAKNHVLW